MEAWSAEKMRSALRATSLVERGVEDVVFDWFDQVFIEPDIGSSASIVGLPVA